MTKRTPIQVCTVDSQPLVHCGVRQLLAPFTDIAVLGEAYDEHDLLHLVAKFPAAVLLIEIDDLGLRWADTLWRCQRAAPLCRLVVFTRSADPARVREAVGTGVSGYVLKRTAPLMLATALRALATGQRVFDPEVTEALLVSESREATLSGALTQREREVLTLLSRGLSNQQIADRMCISVSTVKFHISGLSVKLGVKGRAQAIVRAYEEGLVPRLVTSSSHHVTPQPLPTVSQA